MFPGAKKRVELSSWTYVNLDKFNKNIYLYLQMILLSLTLGENSKKCLANYDRAE